MILVSGAGLPAKYLVEPGLNQDSLRPRASALSDQESMVFGSGPVDSRRIMELIAEKTVNIDMPLPSSMSERKTELRIHKNIIDSIHGDDIEGIKAFVMQNRQPVKDKRIDLYPLKHPFTVRWGEVELAIVHVYAKGVVFDDSQSLSPYHGGGYTSRRMDSCDTGLIHIIDNPIQIQGACRLSEAQREFVVTDSVFFSDNFRYNSILTSYPLGVGRFTVPVLYNLGEKTESINLGFVLFGCTRFQNFRFAKDIFDTPVLLIEVLEQSSRMLRIMHENGLSHPWFHLGNFFTTKNFSVVHDLGESLSAGIDAITEDRFLAQIIIDLYYASRKLHEDQPMAGEIFLTSYFERFTRTKDESFMDAIGEIFREGKDMPVSKIKHPILGFLRQEIIYRIYGNQDYPETVPRFAVKKIRVDKFIASAA